MLKKISKLNLVNELKLHNLVNFYDIHNQMEGPIICPDGKEDGNHHGLGLISSTFYRHSTNIAEWSMLQEL